VTVDYLDRVEAQLVQATERLGRMPTGPDRPPRRPRGWLALVPALAAAAAIVAIVLVTVQSGRGPSRHPQPVPAHRPVVHRHHGAPAPPPAATTPAVTTPAPTTPRHLAPVPAGFSPRSFTAIGELTWWLLGTRPCGARACTTIVRTDDGGRRFVAMPASPAGAVSDLRFADARDGFAFGPQLWATHDGGVSWHAVDVGGDVRDLAAGAGYVYAVRSSGALLRARPSGDTWTAVSIRGSAISLWVDGHTVAVEVQTPSGQRMLVSHDDGTAFATRPLPPSVACRLDVVPAAIWEPCATGTASSVWRSSDDGLTFSAANAGLPELPNSAPFAAASGAVAVTGWRTLYRTTDGGAHWTAIATPPGVTQWSYLGFTDDTHGVALGAAPGGGQRLYYTTDAGAGYHAVPIG
jgi:photosystem II stability/assembly factor-like uncharacterized protein